MKIKIKTWEKMEEEFGLDQDGDIDCNGCFTDTMENDMPEDRIIEVTDSHFSVWLCWEPGDLTYEIADDMIEEVLS